VRLVVLDLSPYDDDVPDDRRGRDVSVPSRHGFADALAKFHGALIAEIRTKPAGIGIDREQPVI
jgi:hypothetical protein